MTITMNLYLIVILSLLVAGWLLEWIVDRLNLRHASTRIPKAFEGIFDAGKYALSQRYLRDNTRLQQMQSNLMLPLTIAFILLGGYRWIQGVVVSVSDSMIVQGLGFFGIVMVLTSLAGLSFDLYDTFVIEKRYDFNRTTPKTFVLDRLKAMLLAVVLGAPLLALILWLFDTVPHAWFWAWAAVSVFQLLLVLVAPVLILPLFNTFVPLDDGELRDRLAAYAAEQRYRLNGIFKIDGSRRSTKSNAYFTGFGKTKRIALFDTLIERHTVGELVCVLAHEVGHCKLGHVWKKLGISMTSTLMMFMLLAFFIRQPGLYHAFGLDGTPLYAGFVFFGFIYAPVSLLLGIVGNALSRKHEYAADAFTARTTGRPDEMINALKRLSEDNLSNLTPHPLKVFLSYSHPPVLQRINALRTPTESKPPSTT